MSPILSRLVFHRKPLEKYRSLYVLSLMIFFYAIYDGFVSYLFPVVLEEQQFSKSMIGFIIGSSSIVGALFDIFLSKFIHKSHFRRMYFVMFFVCFFIPFTLLAAKPIWIFFMAAGLWGIYYDLYNFGNFDFVSRIMPVHEHAGSFGKLSTFLALGKMIAPIMAGFLIGEVIDFKPYMFMEIMLGISFLIFLVVVYLTKERQTKRTALVVKNQSIRHKLVIWKKIGRFLLPILFLTTLINIVDAFFWTIGPLLAESYTALHPFQGLFLTFYLLPALLMGWTVGSIAKKYGKKRSAYISFILGSLFFILFPLMTHPFLILAYIFIGSCCIGIAWPSINGAYADYIAERSIYESEIESLQDFFTNLGYIIGPIIAGIVADYVGNERAFIVLGFLGVCSGIVLWKNTPKKINLPRR